MPVNAPSRAQPSLNARRVKQSAPLPQRADQHAKVYMSLCCLCYCCSPVRLSPNARASSYLLRRVRLSNRMRPNCRQTCHVNVHSCIELGWRAHANDGLKSPRTMPLLFKSTSQTMHAHFRGRFENHVEPQPQPHRLNKKTRQVRPSACQNPGQALGKRWANTRQAGGKPPPFLGKRPGRRWKSSGKTNKNANRRCSRVALS